MNTITYKNKNSVISISKFFALCLVILSHSSDIELMRWSGYFFIPIFFICAGFTTVGPISIKKKFRNLIIPYFIINTIFLFFNYITGHADIISFIGIFYSRFCLFPLGTTTDNLNFLNIQNGPSWFLTALFITYIIYKFLYHIRNRVVSYGIALFYLATTLLLSLSPILLPWSIDTAFLFAVYMFIGKEIREHNILNNNRLILLSFIIYVVLLPVMPHINLSVRQFGTNVFQYVFSVIGAISGSVAIMYLSSFLSKIPKKIINILSQDALIIFMVQIPLIHIGTKVAGLMLLTPALTAILQLVIAIVGGIFIGQSVRYINKLLIKSKSFYVGHLNKSDN